jgi:hypothetical protein
MKITRRAMATMLASAGAQAQTLAQRAPERAATPEAELQSAKEHLSGRIASLAEIEIPMSTEPAFVFKP